jgi:hypothetical protein
VVDSSLHDCAAPGERFELLCGVWLVVASFTLRYRELFYATLNDVVVLALVVIYFCRGDDET